MMWVRRIFARLASRYGYVKMPLGVSAAVGGGFSGFTSLGNPRKQCEAYQYHVYKCVSLIYRRSISVPFSLYKERGDEDEKITRHPFFDLLKKPNDMMTGRDLKAFTFMHRDLCGKAFWLIVRNGLGRPAEVWPLPVANFSRFLFSSDKTTLEGFEFFTDMGKPVQYDCSDIVYFRYPHPLYLYDGASPIQSQALAYDTDMAIRVYQRKFFQNSARPDAVLQTDQRVDPSDARRILMSWRQRHQGVEKAWEPAILDQGLKASILSLSAKDFEFATLAEWTKEDIMEAYNVPPGKLGTVKDVNKANALGIDITFNSECIKPRLDSFDDQVTMSLLPLYDSGLYLKHANCVPRDREFDLEERKTNLGTGYTTINEERQREGMNPVAWGALPFMPISMMQWEGNAPNEENTRAIVADVIAKGRREQIQQGHERRVDTRTKALQKYLRKYFRKQRKIALENLERNYPRYESKDIADQITVFLEEANAELVEGMGPYLEGAIIMGGEEALVAVMADVVFDIHSPNMDAFLEEKEILIRDINETTKSQLRSAILEGIANGEAMDDIAARIKGVFDHAEDYRTLRIARTEINSAANAGALEGYKQSGVVEKKEWLAGAGARKTHSAAASRYRGDGAIPLDEDFHVGAGSGSAPGNIGVAAEDINCRCSLLPVLKS